MLKQGALIIGSIFAIMCFAGCGASANEDRITAIESLTGDVMNGASLFSANCVVCHGSSGMGISGPELTGVDRAEAIDTMLEGPDEMPSYSNLTDQQLADLAAFVVGL